MELRPAIGLVGTVSAALALRPIDLYRAPGGGWESVPDVATPR